VKTTFPEVPQRATIFDIGSLGDFLTKQSHPPTDAAELFSELSYLFPVLRQGLNLRFFIGPLLNRIGPGSQDLMDMVAKQRKAQKVDRHE
jgi:hypothetical protein